MARVTPEQFKLRFETLYPNFELISTYEGSIKPIRYRCRKCGRVYTQSRAENFSRNLKKCVCETIEEHLQQLKKIHPNIEILSEFQKTTDHVKCKCNKCGYIWNTSTIAHLKTSKGCPNCSGVAKKSQEYYQELINKKFPNLKIINFRKQDNFDIQCTLCNHIHKNTSIDTILKSKGCINCQSIFRTPERFVEEMQKINPNIEILGKFTQTKNPIKVKCKICNRVWEPLAKNLIKGLRCTCETRTKGEILIWNILNKYNINFLFQKEISDKIFSQPFLLIDFYLPDYNLFIEYNGKQHYVPIEYFGGEIQFNKQQTRDEELREYCRLNNIKLLELKYDLSPEEIEDKILKILTIDSN